MEPPDPQEPEGEPEIPPPLRVPEEYPGGPPKPERRPDPEVPDQTWF